MATEPEQRHLHGNEKNIKSCGVRLCHHSFHHGLRLITNKPRLEVRARATTCYQKHKKTVENRTNLKKKNYHNTAATENFNIVKKTNPYSNF